MLSFDFCLVMDFNILDNFSLTGSLEDLWCTADGNDREVMADEAPSDPSVSPISSSGSEGCSAAVEILPPFPKGDETLNSLLSDDVPSLDVMLGNEIWDCERQVNFSYKPAFAPPVKQDNLKLKESSGDLSDPMKSRRNAIAAKKNRERKKAQFSALEKEVEKLKAENNSYKKRCTALENGIVTLNKELEYYKAVLANESVLSKLLHNIPNVNGVNLTSSLGKRPNGSASPGPVKVVKSSNGQLNPTTGGVCLHVAKDNVSLEFCSACSSQAAIASSSSSSTKGSSISKNNNNEKES